MRKANFYAAGHDNRSRTGPRSRTADSPSDQACTKDAFPFFADPTRAARVAESWGLGLNWYLNRNVKFQLNYEQTDFTGGGTKGERPKERAILSRFQVAF